MSNKIWIQETWVNQEKEYIIGDSGVYETWAELDQKGKLFKSLQKEYGRCASKMYIDTDDPKNPKVIGWVFEKKEKYTDVNETYIQETWITLHTQPPDHTTKYHYIEA